MEINKQSNTIIGAIAGDIIGSIYEKNNIKTTEFELFNDNCIFTDDTILTIAIADCILHNKNYVETLQKYGLKYKKRGFGSSFIKWLNNSNPKPYNSWGNGSAMRVSAVGFAFNTIKEVLQKAKESAEITHNHQEGIKGAQAVASAIFLAKTGKTKSEIKKYITETFNYELTRTIDNIRPTYKFHVSCQGSIPESVIAFLESKNYEDAIRLAISIGGDSDTIACITGSIAIAYYKKIPKKILDFANTKLPNEFIEIINKFDMRFS